MEQGVKAVWCG